MEDNDENTSEFSSKEQRLPVIWQCPVCGTRVWSSNRKRHLRTRKHRDAQYVLTEKYEIIE